MCVFCVWSVLALFCCRRLPPGAPRALDPSSKILSASQKNDVAAVMAYIAEGISPSYANSLGQTPLHIACMWGNADVAKARVSAGTTLAIWTLELGFSVETRVETSGRVTMTQSIKCVCPVAFQNILRSCLNRRTYILAEIFTPRKNAADRVPVARGGRRSSTRAPTCTP